MRPKDPTYGSPQRRTEPSWRETRAAAQRIDLTRPRSEVYRPDAVHTGIEHTPLPPRGTVARFELEAKIAEMFGEGASDTRIAEATGFDIGQIGHVRRGLGLRGKRRGFHA